MDDNKIKKENQDTGGREGGGEQARTLQSIHIQYIQAHNSIQIQDQNNSSTKNRPDTRPGDTIDRGYINGAITTRGKNTATDNRILKQYRTRKNKQQNKMCVVFLPSKHPRDLSPPTIQQTPHCEQNTTKNQLLKQTNNQSINRLMEEQLSNETNRLFYTQYTVRQPQHTSVLQDHTPPYLTPSSKQTTTFAVGPCCTTPPHATQQINKTQT